MSIAAAHPPSNAALGHESIRVMVVDDAVVVRGLLARWIEAEAGLTVVASLRNGREAIEQLERTDPDVVILDVDMPEIDGITALPRLIARRRDLVVIMASTLTRRNAEISLRALALGAADYIPKPETTREITSSTSFCRELIDKVRTLGMRRKRSGAMARAEAPVAPTPFSGWPSGPPAEVELRQVAGPELAPTFEHPVIKLRPFPSVAPRAVLIGSSTGGPQALNALLARLDNVF